MSAVEIKNVTKIFKKEAAEIVALGETSLNIDAGEFLCLMGPSGSGKSTLLNLVAGIDRPSRGQIIVGGTDISQMNESQLAVWRNHTIGFVFQTFNLIPVLTAFENVELPLLLTKLSKAERREHVETRLRGGDSAHGQEADHKRHCSDHGGDQPPALLHRHSASSRADAHLRSSPVVGTQLSRRGGSLHHVGCHASRSMRARICRKSIDVK